MKKLDIKLDDLSPRAWQILLRILARPSSGGFYGQAEAGDVKILKMLEEKGLINPAIVRPFENRPGHLRFEFDARVTPLGREFINLSADNNRGPFKKL